MEAHAVGWIVLALLTALAESLKDVWAKRLLMERTDFITVAWSLHAFAALLLFPLAGIVDGLRFTAATLPVLGIVATANAIVVVLYMFALRFGELSEVVPLLTLTPAFMLLTSPLLLGESPSWIGVFGVAAIVTGAYVLQWQGAQQRWYEPFAVLVRRPAARAMLAIAIIWSITGNLDKLGVASATPLVWGMLTNAGIALLLLPIVVWRRRRSAPRRKGGVRQLFLLGVFGATVTFSQMTAITMTLVPYVIAVKRLSILLSVLWGGLLLGEQQFRRRLVAAAIMVIGAVVLTMFT